MRPSTGPETDVHAALADIVDELSEAHLDTIELANAAELGIEWGRHVDYLRALRRRTSALLASVAA